MALTSSFFGSTAALKPASTTGTRSVRVLPPQARFLRPIRPKGDVKEAKRGYNSEAQKKGGLVPWDTKWFESQPKRGRKQFDARNENREGGYGRGGPYQKQMLKGGAGKKLPSNIDPLVYTAGLVAVFIFTAFTLVKTS